MRTSRRAAPAALRRRGRAARHVSLALAAGLLGAPLEATGDCQPDPATGGETVTCTGLDADGFSAAPGVDDLTIDVGREAEVRDAAPGAAALGLNDRNRVTIAPSALVAPMPGDPPLEEAGGAISVSGAGSRGILAGDENSVTHDGVFTVSGAGAIGVDAGSRNDIEILDTSPDETAPTAFDVTGQAAIGVRVDDENTVTNRSQLTVAGQDAIGITGDANNTLANLGTLEVTGTGAVGIDVTGPGNDVDNGAGATLRVAGDGAIGIRLPDNADNAFNLGEVLVTGAGATGLQGGDDLGDDNPFNPVAGLGNLDGARIEVTGDAAVGIAADDDNILLNDGEVVAGSAAAGAGAAGIRVGARNGVFFTAGGSVEALGLDAIGVQMTGADNEIDVLAGSSVEASGENAVGIAGPGGNTVTIGGRVSATGTSSVGVELGGAASGVDNDVSVTGTLEASDVAAAAVRFSGGGGNESSLTLESGGLLDAPLSTAVDGSDSVERVVNRGVVRGTVTLRGGDDAFRQEAGGTLEGSLDGGAGSDALELAGAEVDLDAVSGFESLSVLSSPEASAIRGSASFAGGIEVGADATLRVEGSPTVTGDYTQRRDGALEVRVSQTSDPVPALTSDPLTIVGAATLEHGSVFDVDLVEPASPRPLPTGVVTLLEASGGISFVDPPGAGPDDPQEVLIGGLPLGSAVLSFDPTLDATGREFQIQVTRSAYAGFGAGNAARMGAYLDTLLAGATGPVAGLLATLDGLDAAALGQGLGTLQPEAYDALTSTALAAGLEFTRRLHGRPLACGTHPVPGLPEARTLSTCGERGLTPWFDLSGLVGTRDGGSSHIDFDQHGVLAAMGIDARPAEGWLVSGSFGGSYSRVEPDDARGRVGTIDVGAAVAGELGSFLVRGAVSYGRGFHRLSRDVQLGAGGGTADGNYESDRVTVLGSVARPFQVAGWELAPEVQLDYAHLSEESVREIGGAPSLEVDDRSNDLVGLSGLARLSRSILWVGPLNRVPEWWHGTFTPSFHLGLRGVVTGADRDLDARLRADTSGGSVRVDAEDAAWLVRAGLGLEFQPWAYAASVSGHYGFDIGDGTMLHRAEVRVTVPL